MKKAELARGAVLASRYRLEDPLGQGGMGRVYAAIDQQLGRRVAVKLIREELNDAAARDRFLREARAAAVLTHANACQLFEVADHDGTPFLVMELLEGELLSSRLKTGPMSLAEAAGVILPIMDALAAFHVAGLIHRDIKPSNVFLTAQGPKLLDFGLARRTERDDAMTVPAVTVPGAITGTLRYMAPEQLTGDPIDARTDIFALGVMLFEMVTGQVPFGHGSNSDWINAVLTEAPPHLDRPDLEPLDPVVSKALQRRPEDRFATVEEMAEAIRAAIHGEDDAAGPSPAPVPASASSGSNGALRAVVLPFQLLQSDPEIAPLETGVPEMLTARLSGRERWNFVSNRVAQKFADEPDLVSVGRTLRVDRLLAGSILRSGDDYSVTVQLIDTRDGSVEWSQTSQHRAETVVALQEDICSSIVNGFPNGEHDERDRLSAP